MPWSGESRRDPSHTTLSRRTAPGLTASGSLDRRAGGGLRCRSAYRPKALHQWGVASDGDGHSLHAERRAAVERVGLGRRPEGRRRRPAGWLGQAAGLLHGLVTEERKPIVVLVPHCRPVRDEWPWEFVRERVGTRSPGRRGSPPRISIEDTVLDLAAASSETEVIGWVTSAIQTRRTTARRLRQALDSRARCRHRALLRAILADVSEGAESPLEVTYLREVERRHELPRGRRQQRSGHAVRDVVYEEQALVVELDGRLGHDGAGRFKDMWRDNAAAVVGETTLRYGWHDVTDRPCLVARQVAQILGLRGWTGSFAPCSRCRLVPWPMMGVDPAG